VSGVWRKKKKMIVMLTLVNRRDRNRLGKRKRMRNRYRKTTKTTRRKKTIQNARKDGKEKSSSVVRTKEKVEL
jgi:hypothetical protein